MTTTTTTTTTMTTTMTTTITTTTKQQQQQREWRAIRKLTSEHKATEKLKINQDTSDGAELDLLCLFLSKLQFAPQHTHFCRAFAAFYGMAIIITVYSVVQWNWSSVVTGCTWVTCISDIREPISLYQAVHAIQVQLTDTTACFMQLSKPLNTALFGVQKSSQPQPLIHAERMRAARAATPWTPSTDWLSRCCEPWKRYRSSSTQLPRVALCCEPL